MTGPLTVALDAMGGDHAPRETVAGAVQAAATGGVRVLLCGPEETLLDELGGELPPGVDIVHAPQVIGVARGGGLRRTREARLVARPVLPRRA